MNWWLMSAGSGPIGILSWKLGQLGGLKLKVSLSWLCNGKSWLNVAYQGLWSYVTESTTTTSKGSSATQSTPLLLLLLPVLLLVTRQVTGLLTLSQPPSPSLGDSDSVAIPSFQWNKIKTIIIHVHAHLTWNTGLYTHKTAENLV